MFKFLLLTTYLLIISVKSFGLSIEPDKLLKELKTYSLEFLCTDKPKSSFMNFFGDTEEIDTYTSQGVFLTEDGHVLARKSMMENREDFCIEWTDENGNLFNLEADVISQHPEINVVILKVEHPYGEKFPSQKLSFKKIYEGEWVIVITKKLPSADVYFQLGKIHSIFKTGKRDGTIGLSHSLRDEQDGSPVYNVLGELIGFVDWCSVNRNFMFIKSLSSMEEWIKETLGLI